MKKVFEIQNLPSSFQKIYSPSNVQIKTEIIEPFIELKSENIEIKIHLGGFIFIKQKKIKCFALSMNHDWVSLENVIYPLPRDIKKIVKNFIKNEKESMTF